MKNTLNVLLVMITLFYSCGNKNLSKSESAMDNKNTNQEVRNISSLWILDKIENKLVETEDVSLNIKLNDLSFDGKSFCNRMFGNLVADSENKLKFTNIAATRMMCEPAVMKKENELMRSLKMVTSYKIKKDNLYLYDYNGKQSLVFRHAETKKTVDNSNTEKPLYDSEKTSFQRLYDIWGLKKINGKPIDLSKGGVTLELNTKEMRCNGTSSCNSYFGGFLSDDKNELSFTNIGSSLKLCEDMKLETAYFKALDKVKYYELKGLKLFLLDADKSILLEYIKID